MDPYAPITVRPSKSPLPVILAGLLTTGLTMLGVYLMNTSASDFNVMGWYADYILPVGALLVGVAAASGYGVASWISGIKITKSLLWIVLALQVAAYFTAQYIAFHNLHLAYRDGTPVGFFAYFDFLARSFAWKQHDGLPGTPLGMWGYAFRGLEIIGFCGGGVIVPAILRKTAYCEDCQIYMRTKSLALIPASLPHQKIKKSETAALAAYEENQQKTFAESRTRLASFWQLAAEGKTPQLNSELQQFAAGRKQTAKLSQRIEVKLISCRQCWSGQLSATLITGQGKQQTTSPLGMTPVHRDFVHLILQRA